MKLLSFGIGVSGGRCALGDFDGQTLRLSELLRFANEPVRMGSYPRWDIPYLLRKLKQGLAEAERTGHTDVTGVGIGAYCSDFALLDEYDELMSQPFHHSGPLGDAAYLDGILTQQEFYERTGVFPERSCAAYQLYALNREFPALLARARHLLFLPNLLGFYLTGLRSSEKSLASASGMLNIRTRGWDEELLGKLGLDIAILPEILAPGQALGRLNSASREETGMSDAIVSVCGHAAGAALSVPAKRGETCAYLLCGTEAVLGVETDEPITHKIAFAGQYSNRLGFGESVHFTKHMPGQRLTNRLKREYEARHGVISFAEMDEQERAAAPFLALIDPEAPEFAGSGEVTEKIHAFCDRTNQPRPEGLGSLMRCINESSALLCRRNIDALEDVLGYGLPLLRVVGGGIHNRGFMRMLACALERPVRACPDEAAAAGNIAAQLLGLGELKSVWEARTLISESFHAQTYAPGEQSAWREALGRFRETVQGR